MNPAQHVLVFLARAYRATISPALTALLGPLGFGCRFTPTCSQYAIDAVRTHGAIKGCGLALGRLCRCQPWGGGGFDPAPPPNPERRPPGVAATVRSRAGFENGSELDFDAQPPASPSCDLTVAATRKSYPKSQSPLNPAQHGS
jgi:putative membrane protein insertion efficiency factor